MLRRVFISLFFILLALNSKGQAYDWLENKGDHFIVHYLDGDRDLARKVLYQAEKNYVRIADYFGYVRYSNFWK